MSDKEDEVPDAAEPTLLPVGTINLVDSAGGFVLIQSSRFIPFEPGTSMSTVSNSGVGTSHLRVSPARKGQFVTADIVSGMPMVGDRVLMEHVRRQEEADPRANSQAPESPEVQVLE